MKDLCTNFHIRGQGLQIGNQVRGGAEVHQVLCNGFAAPFLVGSEPWLKHTLSKAQDIWSRMSGIAYYTRKLKPTLQIQQQEAVSKQADPSISYIKTRSFSLSMKSRAIAKAF